MEKYPFLGDLILCMNFFGKNLYGLPVTRNTFPLPVKNKITRTGGIPAYKIHTSQKYVRCLLNPIRRFQCLRIVTRTCV